MAKGLKKPRAVFIRNLPVLVCRVTVVETSVCFRLSRLLFFSRLREDCGGAVEPSRAQLINVQKP